MHKNARTILIQLRLMDRYPDFKYAHTQAYTYELLEKYYPDLFAELLQKVKAGNFEPVGAMYVEPDCNLPAAESLVRQLLYGQQYYRRTFGRTVDNVWLPDVFGNSWILPQIMVKAGVRYFVSNKMSTWNDTNRFPHNNFIWRGIDGSQICACVPPTHFITWNMPSQIQENWEAYQDKETGGQTLSMFGYGDGGSGVTEEMIELMHRFDKLSVMPKTEHLGAAEFLHKNFDGNQNLATWDGELYLEMHRGTFTTKAALKRANRALEFALRDAEICDVLRTAAGGSGSADALRAIYKKVLVNQFHDILPGSHIHPVYENAMNDYTEAALALEELQGSEKMWFNSLKFARRAPVFIPDAAGPIVRCGQTGRFTIPGLAPFASAEQLPALPAVPGWLAADGLQVQTPLHRIAFAEDGSILHLWDETLHREWVDGVWNRLHLYRDLPGVYDAWDILPNYADREFPFAVAEALRLRYADDAMAEFTCVLTTESSRLTRVIRLFAASPMIEVEHCVDWHETHKLAKVEFGVNVLTRELVCDTSAGYIRRETHRNTSWQKARFEVCTQMVRSIRDRRRRGLCQRGPVRRWRAGQPCDAEPAAGAPAPGHPGGPGPAYVLLPDPAACGRPGRGRRRAFCAGTERPAAPPGAARRTSGTAAPFAGGPGAGGRQPGAAGHEAQRGRHGGDRALVRDRRPPRRRPHEHACSARRSAGGRPGRAGRRAALPSV